MSEIDDLINRISDVEGEIRKLNLQRFNLNQKLELCKRTYCEKHGIKLNRKGKYDRKNIYQEKL